MLFEEKKIQSVVSGFQCDRCGKAVSKENDPFEYQAGHHISFVGGYGSVFGDGAEVKCDLCQDCLKALIQDCCRVSPDPR